MAHYGVDITLTQLLFGSKIATTFSYTTTTAVDEADLIDISGTWDDDWLDAINALQHVDCTNFKMRTAVQGLSVIPYETPVGSGGQLALGDELKLPPEFALWFRYGVGDTSRLVTDVPDTTYPIRRGGFYLSGIGSDWIDDGATVPPTANVDELATLVALFTTDLVVAGSINLTPSVIGQNISLGVGMGHIPGTVRYAEITAVAAPRMTMVRSRRA